MPISHTARSALKVDETRQAARHGDSFVPRAAIFLPHLDFYHEELKSPRRYDFCADRKGFAHEPPITDLWLSGGEPTLRHDASEIIDMFVRRNGVRALESFHHGLVKARVYEIVYRP